MSANIKSIVAFDLETTGLPTYDGFRTKITEISFVAISVEHLNLLKSSQTIPRVVHKLSLCFNPRKRIDDGASEKTGLDNFLLEHEKSFTEISGNLIKSYLEHLQQPVCLIAHNGDDFDFPILVKELEKVNVTLQENVLCIDSLRAFREIDTINEKKQVDRVNEKSETIELQELPDDYIDNTESLTKLEDDSDREDDSVYHQQLNETTPHRLTDNSTPKRKLFGSATEGSATKKLRQTRLSCNTPKRQLFTDSVVSPSTKRPNNPNQFKKGYKLTELYKRFYKKDPTVAHHAEADVLLLLQCIAATKKDFIQFMNEDAELFSEIKPLGTIIKH